MSLTYLDSGVLITLKTTKPLYRLKEIQVISIAN